jgi:acylphosphatase
MSPAESLRGRVHAIIHGRVQRVFFRAATEKEARRLGLCGWVRNCPDGSVELLAEGTRTALEELVAWCGHGPARAVVENVASSWQEYRGEFKEFSVRSDP